MAIKKITIDQFPELASQHPVIDVRSPGEYIHAHIPGSYSLPLFTDEERKVVGTAYKQQGKQPAVKLGLDFFGGKMGLMVEEAERILKQHRLKNKTFTNPQPSFLNPQVLTGNPQTVLLHCWRGGMRSAGVAWLLDVYGFNVYTLVGGYKAFRNWVLKQFSQPYDYRILGGYTGSGKTALLKQIENEGQAIIDLEGIANHKGSAFGGLGQPAQPTQEMFENLLATELNKLKDHCFWLEDESQRIGSLNIPHMFWNDMRTKPVYFIDIPSEKRLEYITAEYGKHEKETLVNAIIRIQKRLGPQETKMAIHFLIEDKYQDCFRILLAYYDKTYNKSLHARENLDALLNKINCNAVDILSNSEKLISCTTANTC